jgi:hypothetical protein
VPDGAHFAHTATFINPSRQEAVAFVAARPTSDGSAAVMALGIMGGRSLFSTATTCMTDLQSWFHRQSPQDFFYPSALLWPESTRTLLISDCEFCSVEEIDALTGELLMSAAHPIYIILCIGTCNFMRTYFRFSQAIHARAFLACQITTGRWISRIQTPTISAQRKTALRCLWLAVMAGFT